MEEKVYTIDAANRPIGRVATEVAVILLGKDSPEFVKNRVLPVRVTIQNVDKLSISEKKRLQKEYQRYSGYPGGQKTENLQQLLDRKGYQEVLRKAIYGMLPNNRLRKDRMKRIEFSK